MRAKAGEGEDRECKHRQLVFNGQFLHSRKPWNKLDTRLQLREYLHESKRRSGSISFMICKRATSTVDRRIRLIRCKQTTLKAILGILTKSGRSNSKKRPLGFENECVGAVQSEMF